MSHGAKTRSSLHFQYITVPYEPQTADGGPLPPAFCLLPAAFTNSLTARLNGSGCSFLGRNAPFAHGFTAGSRSQGPLKFACARGIHPLRFCFKLPTLRSSSSHWSEAAIACA